MGTLQTLLSDPESMENLAQLAAMIGQSTENADDETTADKASSQQTPLASNETSDGFAFDPTKLLLLGEILSVMQQKDENTAFLYALKPYLSEERCKRVDRAVKLLRLYSAYLALKEKGMLSELSGLL